MSLYKSKVAFELSGRPISKKRNYVISKGRMFLGKSYKKWEKSAVEQLQSVPQAHKGELKVTYVFQMKGKYKVDLDNLIVGINDVLQAANVIENDDSITEIKAKKLGGFDDWTTYVIIE